MTSLCGIAAAALLAAAPALALRAQLPPDPMQRPPDAATIADDYGDLIDVQVDEPDPLESMNRTFFGFNQRVDRFVIEPVARVYGFIVPKPAKRAVLRVFANLNSPSILINDLLQLEVRRASVTLSRFVINTTVGVVGLVDMAERMGLDPHHADFGQTLARVGLGSGPYLVFPMFGSSTARDAVGTAVDTLFRPQTYFLGPMELLLVGTGTGVLTREAYIEELEALQESSVDYYATIRNLYFQRRAVVMREVGALEPDVEEEAPLEAPAPPEPPAEDTGPEVEGP
jgi:phospholipid-binding lipoprotein MlaA